MPKTVAFADPLSTSIAAAPDLSTCSSLKPGSTRAVHVKGGAQCSKPKNTVQTLLFGVVGIMFGLSIMYLISRIMAMNRKIVQLERESKRQVTAEYVEEYVARSVKELAPAAAVPVTPVVAPIPLPVPIPPLPKAPVVHAETDKLKRHAAAPSPSATVPSVPSVPSVQQQQPTPPRPPPSVTMPHPMPFEIGMMSMPLPFGMPLPPDMLMDLLMSGGGIMEINLADISGGNLGTPQSFERPEEPRFEEVHDEEQNVCIDIAACAKDTHQSAEASAVDKVVSDTLGPLARVVDALEQESKSRESVAQTTDDNKTSSGDDESDSDGGAAAIKLAPANAPPARRSTRRSASGRGTGNAASSRQRKK